MDANGYGVIGIGPGGSTGPAEDKLDIIVWPIRVNLDKEKVASRSQALGLLWEKLEMWRKKKEFDDKLNRNP